MHLPAHLPGPLRAAVGLVATAADEAKNLPDRAIELPMLAVSTALQLSLRAQQRYAQLTVRGDEAFSALSGQGASDEPPAWATFDEDLPDGGPPAGESSITAAEITDPEPVIEPVPAQLPMPEPLAEPVSEPAPAPASEPAPAEPEPAPAAEKAPATKQAPARKSPAKKAAAKKSAPADSNGKGVSAPRHTTPSRFDTIGDE